MQTNTVEQWLQERTRRYGPISKLSPFGTPTVFLRGQRADRFIFTCDGNMLSNQQPPSVRRICGERNMTELFGDDRKRVRGALVSFLKPEMLKQYVGKMDEEVRRHLEMHWHGNQKVMNIDQELLSERRAALEQRIAVPSKDLITCLLHVRNDNPSILMHLATDRSVYANIMQEQEEIAKTKTSNELLTSDDLSKMKYTWRVAMETLRMNPPLLGSFRKVLKDFEYEGYTIPKGWQVIWAAWMTHMDERIFPDPSKFDPTRLEKQASAPPYCFVAFGGGA
ncbi:hypothetical protein DITRI_Ditri03aG0045300 [Diplodiscus trichospermus]